MTVAMVERRPSPEAELIDDIKDVTLEAAAQVLSGIALARRASEKIAQRLQTKLGTGADLSAGLGPLGDLLFNGARLSTEQLRAALAFQRWASDAVVASLVRGIPTAASSPKKPNRPRESFDVKLGKRVVCGVNRPDGVEHVTRSNAYVQLRADAGGPRFYVEWELAEAPERAEHERFWFELCTDAPNFALGDYSGHIVIEDGDGHPVATEIQLHVKAP